MLSPERDVPWSSLQTGCFQVGTASISYTILSRTEHDTLFVFNEWMSVWVHEWIMWKTGITSARAVTGPREHRPNNSLDPICFHCSTADESLQCPTRQNERSISNSPYIQSYSTEVMFKLGPMIARRHGKSRGWGSIFPHWFDFHDLLPMVESVSLGAVAHEEVAAGLPPLIWIIFTDLSPRQLRNEGRLTVHSVDINSTTHKEKETSISWVWFYNTKAEKAFPYEHSLSYSYFILFFFTILLEGCSSGKKKKT